MAEQIIHFGEFIRWHRVNAGKTTDALGREVGLTARRLIAIEAMAEPAIQHTTLAALGRAFGMDAIAFDQAWRTTAVPVTRRKAGPTTDAAQRYAAACRASGVTPAEGMRRLRAWILEQDPTTQRAALGFAGGAAAATGTFTTAVDHLQDPAAAVAERVGRRAASSAKSRGPAATGENKRR